MYSCWKIQKSYPNGIYGKKIHQNDERYKKEVLQHLNDH